MAPTSKTNPVILGVADTIPAEIKVDKFRKWPREKRVKKLLSHSVEQLCEFLEVDWQLLKPEITDMISFGPSIYNPLKYHDTLHKAESLGLTGINTHFIDMGGASPVAGLEQAMAIIKLHPEAVILMAGADVPRSGFKTRQDYVKLNENVADPEHEAPYEGTLVAFYAFLARHLMRNHGITEADLKELTSYYRGLGMKNERAFNYNKPITEKELSKYFAEPYSVPMVAVATDHAFATLLCSEETFQNKLQGKIIKKNIKPVYLAAAASATHASHLSFKGNLESPARVAGPLALAQAGLEPHDLDYAWVYDCFPGMLISQAADYTGIPEADVSKTLQRGKLVFDNKEIAVNLGGGILNYRAALMLSAAAGLVDVLSQYGLAAQPIKEILPQRPGYALLGGNGGLDAMNAVAILSAKPYGREPKKIKRPTLTLNNPQKTENSGGTIYAITQVHFNTGGNLKPPYVLVLIKKADGFYTVSNLFDKEGNMICRADEVQEDAEVVFKEIDGNLQAVLV